MKKIFSMFSAAALVVVMAACGNKQAETADTCCADTVVVVDTCSPDTVVEDTVAPVDEVKAQPAKPKTEPTKTEPAKTEPTRNSTVVKSENVQIGGAKTQVTDEVKNSMSTAAKNTKDAVDKKAEEAEKAARNNWKESRNK